MLQELAGRALEILKKKGDYYLILDMRGQTQWSIKDNLKLIQHRIDLNMVLEAWYQKWREEEISKLNFPDDYYKEFVWERFANYYKDEIHSLLIRWQLRKDNKWLTLEDQSEDFFKFIINILGEK